MNTIDIEHLRSWVGKENVVADDLSLFPARALAAALDHAALPEKGAALPPAWHWLYFLDTPTASRTGSDGHPLKGSFLPPVTLPRRMWAAGTLEVEQPLLLGTPARKQSTIRSVELKEGKSGALVFVNIEHALYQNERRCILEQQNVVYRDMPAAPAPLAPGEPDRAEADWVETVVPDPVLLFRFSALTYNGHRIHYDRDYATQVEFYPALVVHGPLLATLLLDLVAANVADKRVGKFSFRALRPIFDHAPFKVCGKREGDAVRLWTVDADGFVCTTASVELV
ncbi:MAG: acyl-CoA dehydrogenase [Rhodocyclaceae bacterium]|nr:acyl-CoA dehydrogenase [Rhodocyclaceae bacterium]